MSTSLEELRQKLDAIDSQIIQLLEERFTITDEVAVVKDAQGIPLTDPIREQTMLDGFRNSIRHPVLKESIGDIYRMLFNQNKTARVLHTVHSQPFHSIGIIGLGMIGGSIVKTLHTKNPDQVIRTVQRDSADIKRALDQKYLTEAVADIPALVNSSDLIILATPIQVTPEIARTIASVQSDTPVTVIDVASVKEKLDTTFETLSNEHITFCGTHPMAGSEKTGFEDASGLLFVRKPWAITPNTKTSEDTVERIRQFVSYLGSDPVVVSAKQHDEYAAAVSHIVFLMSCFLYGFMYTGHKEAMSLAGSGFESMTRLASGSPAMHTQILQENYDNIAVQFMRFLEYVKGQDLASETMLQLFEAIKADRDAFMKDRTM